MANEFAVNRKDLEAISRKICSYDHRNSAILLKFPEEFISGITNVDSEHKYRYECVYYANGVMEAYHLNNGVGTKTFSDKFWEGYQGDHSYPASRKDYSGAFMNWSAYQYTPKYGLYNLTNGSECFRNFNNAGMNGKPYCADYYLSATNFSRATNVQNVFMAAVVASIDRLDFSNATSAERAFYASEIPTIDKLVFPSKADITGMFVYASLLTNITIEGTIKQNGLNLQWSTKLTYNSLMEFINALEDKSADTSGTAWKITIGSTNLAKLSEEDLAIAWNKGWEVV